RGRATTGAAEAGAGATAIESSTTRAGNSTAAAAGASESASALDTSDPGAMIASLTKAKPSEAATVLSQVQSDSPAAFEAVRDKARSSIPSIPAPTGLPAKGERPKPGARGAVEA